MYYVYKFLDKQSNIIYIGKAKTLSSRINNHNHLPQECYDSIHKVQYIELNNHSEGSIYEIYYINKYSPKYNIIDNRKDCISFELPKKEWKSFNCIINNRETKNNDILSKIKQHRLQGDIVVKIKDGYQVYKKETIQKNKERYESLLNNTFIYFDFDNLFKGLLHHENISEVNYSDKFYCHKNLKYDNKNRVYAGRLNIRVDYDKIFVCYDIKNNLIFIDLNQDENITLKYKKVNILDVKNVINKYNNYETINIENLLDESFCTEPCILDIKDYYEFKCRTT